MAKNAKFIENITFASDGNTTDFGDLAAKTLVNSSAIL